MNKKDVNKLLQAIEKSKIIIAKERDKLRGIYDDLESILDSLDRGLENIEDGERLIEQGIDNLSEYL